MNPPIIEVSVCDDGSITYSLRPSLLDTRMYAVILATLARYVAQMMEAEGGLRKEDVQAEIEGYLQAELVKPTEPMSVHMLQ